MEVIVLHDFRKRLARAHQALFHHRPAAAGSKRTGSNRRWLEPLEPRLVLDAGPLLISEFMALNETTLADRDGEYSDWIEIYNPTDAAIDLDGWYLTDDADDLTRWEFPAVELAAHEYRVVFASNKDRSDPAELHTNFQIDGDGEYLALIRPDGTTIAHEFAPSFPPQSADVSYGLTPDLKRLVREGARLSYLVPTSGDAALETTWYTSDFDDSAWAGGSQLLPVLITEVGTGDPDFVEIQNLSGEPADTSGWIVAVNNADDRQHDPDINAWHTTVWNLPDLMGVDEVLHRSDINDGSGNYWGDNIFWRTSGPGWVMILDDEGNVADFVVWRYDLAEIASLDVTIDGHHVTADGIWTGDALPANVDSNHSYQRIGSVDRDDSSDWGVITPITMGDQNDGLSPPFPSGPTTGIGFTGGGFADAIRTNVAPDMEGVNTSLWTRISFEGGNTFILDTLALRMRYDDGFVAYLNGQEVASRNAPDPVHWNSAALSDRPNGNAGTYQDIDLTAELGLVTSGTNVLAIHGLNESLADGEFLVLPQLVATSGQAVLRYMDVPTPGDLNDRGLTEAPRFSHQSGICIDPFELTLQVESSTATIHYTTNGSIPTQASPLYTSPISISTTARIRARAHEADRGLGPVISHGYIFLDASAASFNSDVPVIVLDSYGGGLGDTLLTPVTSVFIETGADGRADITDAHEFAGRAGLRIRGQSSQGWPKAQYAFEVWDEGNQDTGPISALYTDDLSVSLFGMPAESDWVIQGPYSDKTLMRNYLSYTWSNNIGTYAPRTRFCEVFLNTGGGKVSYPGDYVGSYVFMEKIKVDPNRVDIAEITPADNSQPEITGGYIWKKDKIDPGEQYWYTNRGQALLYVEPEAHSPPDPSDITSAQRSYLLNYINQFEAALYGPNFTDPVLGYANYIDVDSFIDDWILVEMTKNIDGFRLSTYYHKDRGGKIEMGPIWDYNLSLGNANYLEGWLTAGWYCDQLGEGDYPYWRQLFQDPNFKQALVDRWQELRRDVFSTPQLLADVNAAAGILNESQVRNFQKWPILGVELWPNWYVGQTWQQEVDWMKQWLAARVTWMDSQFLTGVTFNQDGGIVDPGFGVTLSAPTGTIYYTLDGSDPRLSGGAVNTGSAFVYSGTPISISESTVVKARAKSGSNWSGIHAAEFFVGQAASKANLAITEINYNPYDPTPAELAIDPNFENDDFEFIELRNISAEYVVLGGVQFTGGIEFDFTSATVRTLPPGEYIVIACNPAAFQARYGTGITLAGQYDLNLANGGEQITLVDQFGQELFDFDYDDRGDWPGRADGKGAALELIDPTAVPQNEPFRTSYLENGDNWRSSIKFGGTPAADPQPAIGIVVNEVLSRSLEPVTLDTIELYNTTGSPIDMGGWYLSDDWGWDPTSVEGNYKKYRIPNGTIIPAGGYRVFDEQDFNPSGGASPNDFALDGVHGDDVWLMKADAAGNLTHFVDHVDFGAVAYEKTLGRWPNGQGELYPMITPTLDKLNPQNGENSGPRVGPVILSEVHYNPRLVGADDNLEFIEIYNPTQETVLLANWQIGGAVDYSFPADAVLEPQATLVILPFPLSNGDLWSAFCTEYGLDVAETDGFLGEYTRQLDDGGERVQLLRPGDPPPDQLDFFPLLLEDEVNYDDEAPWPVDADGGGSSLHRTEIDAWGNTYLSWSALVPTPGMVPWLTAEVVGRHIFYNCSEFDGNSAAADVRDDTAIAVDKAALLPGGTATSVNYTSYSRGINGIMIDVDGMPPGVILDTDDFQFRVGNSDNPGSWAVGPGPSSITVRPGEGVDDSDRITILWPDNAIQKEWLQVTVLTTDSTRLPEEDVFYFGNAIGESGNSDTDAKVNATDMLAARNNQRTFINPAPIDFNYDYDRDARVNATDMLIARNNQTSFLDALELITVPAGKAAGEDAAEVEGVPAHDTVFQQAAGGDSAHGEVSAGKMAWLYEFAPTRARERPSEKPNRGEAAVAKLLADAWL